MFELWKLYCRVLERKTMLLKNPKVKFERREIPKKPGKEEKPEKKTPKKTAQKTK